MGASGAHDRWPSEIPSHLPIKTQRKELKIQFTGGEKCVLCSRAVFNWEGSIHPSIQVGCCKMWAILVRSCIIPQHLRTTETRQGRHSQGLQQRRIRKGFCCPSRHHSPHPVGPPMCRWLQFIMSSSSSARAEQAAEESPEEKRQRRILASSLYIQVSPDKEPLVYSSAYNIGFMGLEKLHPFDSAKWGRIRDFLVNENIVDASRIVEPAEATKEDLLVVHTEDYLQSLTRSFNVAAIIEVPPVALLPSSIVKRQVLQPFRKQVGGTVLAGKLAKERGWAINLGGGFHHCCGYRGGGFCVYADITLCIQFAFSQLSISKVMIIDLDAHQGNGHERDFPNDDRVYIFDMYNRDIYPYDAEAKRAINQRVEITSGTSTEEYLQRLDAELKSAKEAFQPDYVVFNAGTDVLDGDPLGKLCVSADGISRRDEMVFRFAKDLGAPIVMVTSGGYMKTSARVIADSITNLASKRLITLQSATPQTLRTPT